jgi:replicative DNA helicase
MIIIAARPSVGKCLAFDSEIITSDGAVRTIEELYRDNQQALNRFRRLIRLAQPSVGLCGGLAVTGC